MNEGIITVTHTY